MGPPWGAQQASDSLSLQVSYVGDHLLTDVGAAKTKAGWSTVAVVEELEEQVPPAGWS